MPELPEVQTVVTTLGPNLAGRAIRDVLLLRSDIIQPLGTDLAVLLTGRTFVSVQRRGKRIIILLDDGNRFYIHLGMTGRLTMEDIDAEVIAHTHLTITLSATSAQNANSSRPMQLRFRDPRRFGGIWWLGKGDGAHGMGPEPLSMKPSQLAKRLASTTRAIKSALLDQSILAGLGNIYVDESLFAAGIHPQIPAYQLGDEDIKKLNRAIKSTLRRALRHRGSTLRDYRDANGIPGGFQKLHRVYDREGMPCATCKTKIERIVMGGRSTHFCPRCQKR